jgi:hypothetical protein
MNLRAIFAIPDRPKLLDFFKVAVKSILEVFNLSEGKVRASTFQSGQFSSTLGAQACCKLSSQIVSSIIEALGTEHE